MANIFTRNCAFVFVFTLMTSLNLFALDFDSFRRQIREQYTSIAETLQTADKIVNTIRDVASIEIPSGIKDIGKELNKIINDQDALKDTLEFLKDFESLPSILKGFASAYTGEIENCSKGVLAMFKKFESMDDVTLERLQQKSIRTGIETLRLTPDLLTAAIEQNSFQEAIYLAKIQGKMIRLLIDVISAADLEVEDFADCLNLYTALEDQLNAMAS